MARSTNPIRFGIRPRGLPYDIILAMTQAAEDCGFESAAFGDRLPENNIEAWTLATAVGVQTRKILLTHSTLNVPYRNPALVAKMAASLDCITGGGRILLTIGAGRGGPEEAHYIPYGFFFGSPGQRFTDLKDAVEIMRGMWANETFTYRGERFHVEGAKLAPKPVNGRISIIIGAGGPRMRRLAGAVGDGWIKDGGWPESPEEYVGMLHDMEEGAERAGRDPRTIRRVLNGSLYIGEEDPATRAPAVPNTQGGLWGTADRILETIEEYVDLGVDTFQLEIARDGWQEQIQRFGEEVIARVRS